MPLHLQLVIFFYMMTHVYTIPSSFYAFSRDEASSNVFLVDNFKMDFLRQHYCHGAREVTASDSCVYIHAHFSWCSSDKFPSHRQKFSWNRRIGEEAIRNVAAKEDYVIAPLFPNQYKNKNNFARGYSFNPHTIYVIHVSVRLAK